MLRIGEAVEAGKVGEAVSSSKQKWSDPAQLVGPVQGTLRIQSSPKRTWGYPVYRIFRGLPGLTSNVGPSHFKIRAAPRPNIKLKGPSSPLPFPFSRKQLNKACSPWYTKGQRSHYGKLLFSQKNMIFHQYIFPNVSFFPSGEAHNDKQ